MRIKEGIFEKREPGTIVTTVDIGARVKRGPDWRWDDQDGGGEGVILNTSAEGWVCVQWYPGGVNNYRIGGKYEDVVGFDLIYA